MKLIFTKGENQEITVQLTKGTVVENFSYIEMIKQLLQNNKFEDTEYKNISAEEKARINEMLKKINEAIETQPEQNNSK